MTTSDYVPPDTTSHDTEPVPVEYTEPDMTSHDVKQVRPPAYVPPYIHEDEPEAEAKEGTGQEEHGQEVTTTSAPDLNQVKAWLGLEAGDTADDVVLQQSLDAALDHLAQVATLPTDPFGDPVFTADLTEAVLLVTQRLAARRNSPEGVVGISGAGGDFISARVPFSDPDVMQLVGPYRNMPVA